MKQTNTYADFLKQNARLSLKDRKWAFRVWVQATHPNLASTRNLTKDDKLDK